MARIIPYKNKDGKIISYQIRVFRGKDANEKELKPYTMTWRVPETYKSEEAIKRALQKVVGEFETECRRGLVSVDKRTFAEYAAYFLELQERDNKHKTVTFYSTLLSRINESIGSMRLSSITAKDLNKFYLSLEAPDARLDSKAAAKDTLIELKKAKELTHPQIIETSGLSKNTVTNVFQGKNVAMQTAEKIAAVFNCNVKEIFQIIPAASGNGLSPKTIHHYHALIHDILALALSEGIVPRNVADAAKPPKMKRKESEFFEIEELLEIRKALDTAPLKYRAMLYILIETGCRRGELVGLKWDAVNFKTNEITLANNLQYSKKKGLYEETLKEGDAHIISVSADLIEFLRSYKEEQDTLRVMLAIPGYNEADYLFIQEDGRPMHPDTLYGWMQNFAKENNLPHMHPHKFRHSQASILIAAGIDLLTISKRLGHSQTSTTQDIYGHLLRQSDRKASDAITNALSYSGKKVY